MPDKKSLKGGFCRGTSTDPETSTPCSTANRDLPYFQQCFLTYCQQESGWIVKAIPKATLTAVFKAKSAARCWRSPHLRAPGKCRPSIKHKTKMHYHLECITGEQPWEKRKFSKLVTHLWHGQIPSAPVHAYANSKSLTGIMKSRY